MTNKIIDKETGIVIISFLIIVIFLIVGLIQIINVHDHVQDYEEAKLDFLETYWDLRVNSQNNLKNYENEINVVINCSKLENIGRENEN